MKTTMHADTAVINNDHARSTNRRRPVCAPDTGPAPSRAACCRLVGWTLAAAVLVGAAATPVSGQPAETRESAPAAEASSIQQPPNPSLQGRKPSVVARINQLRQAILDGDQSAETWGRLGWTLMVHGFGQETVDCLSQAAALDPADMRWPYLAGLTLLRIDRTKARFHLQKAVEIDGDYLPARIHYARLLAQAGEASESRAQFAVVCQGQPDSWHAQVAAASAARELGDLELALRHLDQALELAPDEQLVRRHRADLFRRLNDPEQARRERARAEALPPSPPMADPVLEAARADAAPAQLHFQRGLNHYHAGRIEEAITAWEKAAEADPDADIVSVYLGPALVRAGRPADAVEHYKRALRSAPDNAVLLMRTAALLRTTGEIFEAIQYYRQALKVRPGEPDAMFGLGECLYALGQFEPAVEQFTAALATDPDREEFWLFLADAQYQLGRHDTAMKAAADGLRRFPALGGLDVVMGKCLQEQGQPAKALAAFKTAAQHSADDWLCQQALAEAYLSLPDKQLRDPKAALPAALRAAELAPDSPKASATLALAFLRNGRHTDALTVAERILTRQPDHPSALLVAALSYAHLGRTDNARPLIARVRELVASGASVDAATGELLTEAEQLLD
ncbi:MAG TPA: tetratricopeptide repeat protein [Phycisphaerae bacterium]|nr:tetratricopeptide repeat protein [Phycisphaerae bacterium]